MENNNKTMTEQEPTGLGNYFVHYLVGYFCCYGPIFYDAGRKRF